MRRFALLVVALPAGALAIIPDFGPDNSYLGVGQLSGASCVAIAPNWVITAKHVGGMNVLINGLSATAFERFDHADADISLLHFNETFTTYYTPDFANMLGSRATMVGYGSTGTPNATGITITGNAGIRRKAANTVDLLESVTFDNIHFFDAWIYDLDGPSGNGTLGAGAVANEGGLWGGDSGGGWFTEGNGAPRLVGINSFIADGTGNSNLSDYGDLGGAVALRSYQGFIEGHIGAVPEPMSMAGLGAGLLLLLKRRRK